MSNIILNQPISNRFRTINLSKGDLVKIVEWDGIKVKGIVKEITDAKIVVHQAKFLEGCYVQCDYSHFEQQTEFVFELENVCEIKVAQLEPMSPLTLVQQALAENYCGSERIVMSPLFFQQYQRYVKESTSKYGQYSIEVNLSLYGYCVYAIPNEESKKHKESPMKCYSLEFFENGKYIAASTISTFDDNLESTIQESANRIKQKTKQTRIAYRLKFDGIPVKRGVV
ncbi:hypothetical protein [Viridibacillus arvi]|uniref:hypothetical protein n=1 Tax=Viridibacillus arvi TaxID=263475 RepID=UPI0034CEA2B6